MNKLLIIALLAVAVFGQLDGDVQSKIFECYMGNVKTMDCAAGGPGCYYKATFACLKKSFGGYSQPTNLAQDQFQYTQELMPEICGFLFNATKDEGVMILLK